MYWKFDMIFKELIGSKKMNQTMTASLKPLNYDKLNNCNTIKALFTEALSV